MLTCVVAGKGENGHISIKSESEYKSNKPESAWTTVAGVHVGQPGADHRVAGHLVALASKSLQGRVVTVRELKRKKVF